MGDRAVIKYISKILLEACVLATATWVFISHVVIVEDKESLKPDTFQCPHCGTTLKWSEELWRGYIECRSGWTAATPNPVTTNAATTASRKVGSIGWELKHIYETNNPYCSGEALGDRLYSEVKDLRLRVKRLEDKIETMSKPISLEEYIATNRVWITRDPIDNMPMFGVDIDGRLVP